MADAAEAVVRLDTGVYWSDDGGDANWVSTGHGCAIGLHPASAVSTGMGTTVMAVAVEGPVIGAAAGDCISGATLGCCCCSDGGGVAIERGSEEGTLTVIVACTCRFAAWTAMAVTGAGATTSGSSADVAAGATDTAASNPALSAAATSQSTTSRSTSSGVDAGTGRSTATSTAA